MDDCKHRSLPCSDVADNHLPISLVEFLLDFFHFLFKEIDGHNITSFLCLLVVYKREELSASANKKPIPDGTGFYCLVPYTFGYLP